MLIRDFGSFPNQDVEIIKNDHEMPKNTKKRSVVFSMSYSLSCFLDFVTFVIKRLFQQPDYYGGGAVTTVHPKWR